jgi:hypothetical protein
MVKAMPLPLHAQDLLGDSEAVAGALESFAVFVTLGIADDLSFERFDRMLQVFDKPPHDTDCGRLIFDLDGNLAAHKLILPRRGQSQPAQSNARVKNKIDH